MCEHGTKTTPVSKLGRMVTFLPIKLPTVAIATRLGKVVAYLEGILPTKRHDPMTTCSYKIT